MSSAFFVYVEHDIVEGPSDLITESLAEALELFLHAVSHSEDAALVWSS